MTRADWAMALAVALGGGLAFAGQVLALVWIWAVLVGA